MKSVSIIGMGHSYHSYMRDFDEHNRRPTDEAWGVNNIMFEFEPDTLTHGIAMDNFGRDLKMDKGVHFGYVQKMLGCGLPIISDVANPDWPQVEEYPIEAVVDDIWPGLSRMFPFPIPDLENTINYAIALAIHRKFDRIALYGCDFRRLDDKAMIVDVTEALEPIKPWWFVYHDRDIVEHRRDLEPGEPTAMFLLGIAYQRGIKIHIPEGSTLFGMDRFRYFYGYQDQPKRWRDDEPV